MYNDKFFEDNKNSCLEQEIKKQELQICNAKSIFEY